MLNVARVLVAFLVGLVCADARPAAQVAESDYRLKAAVVHQFPQFVEWPSATWREARRLQLCVVEPNPFGSELEQLIRGETLNGRPLAVKEIYGSDELAGCHVLFVSMRSGDPSSVLKVTTGRPVLTIGESDGFLEDGGIILMKIVDGKVRFEVHATNAQKAGLRISSQLLSLALAVRGGPS
jgi:hypothetical protein